MKRIVAFILLVCVILTFAACGKVEITMQEIYDASQPEAMLKNHEGVYIREEMDGEFVRETYLTKEYFYSYMPDEAYPWLEFMTDDVCYYYAGDECVRYVFVTPDGVGSFAGDRAESGAVLLGADAVDYTIESISKKDGRITVTGQENLGDMAEFGVTSAKFEYVLDAKTRELISLTSDYTYEDGTVCNVVAEVTYDADVPETLKTILEYENRTENLRNVTVVSNPGTEKEVRQTVQTPKGLVFGFEYDEAFEGKAEFYADAACTEAYDPYADIDSDLTVYVKWAE